MFADGIDFQWIYAARFTRFPSFLALWPPNMLPTISVWFCVCMCVCVDVPFGFASKFIGTQTPTHTRRESNERIYIGRGVVLLPGSQ